MATTSRAPQADDWLRLDELENAIDNLEFCHHALATYDIQRRWKWAIVSLHQALYGFAICAIKGTNDLSVLRDPTDHNSPLINIWEALKRLEDPNCLWPGATPVVLDPDERRDLGHFVEEFRNGFEHFRPKGWSIERSGMPALLSRVLAIVTRIALHSQSVRYYEAGSEDHTRSAIAALSAQLRAIAV